MQSLTRNPAAACIVLDSVVGEWAAKEIVIDSLQRHMERNADCEYEGLGHFSSMILSLLGYPRPSSEDLVEAGQRLTQLVMRVLPKSVAALGIGSSFRLEFAFNHWQLSLDQANEYNEASSDRFSLKIVPRAAL